jgi:hypothetical protein
VARVVRFDFLAPEQAAIIFEIVHPLVPALPSPTVDNDAYTDKKLTPSKVAPISISRKTGVA